MKILIDPVHTNDPMLCSMNYKIQMMIKYLNEKRNDLIFYYCIPENYIGNENWQTDDMPKIDNVKYIKIPTSRQRMIEYYRMDAKFYDLFKFWGPMWDWDIMISCKFPLFSQYHFMSNVKQHNRHIIGLEDMPIVSFKKFINVYDENVQDLNTLSGYLISDKTFIFSYWEKGEIIKRARDLFSAMSIKRMIAKMQETTPIVIEKIKYKTAEEIQERTTREFFNIGYTQRFEMIRRNVEDVMNIFEKLYILRGQKMKLIVTSNSRGYKGYNVSHFFVEFSRPNRKEFWNIIDNVFDVILVMSEEEGFSLSLLEPIMKGVPAIVLRKPYAEATLKEDYPFFVNSWVEAMSVLDSFYRDYAKAYEKFRIWGEKYEILLAQRNLEYFPMLMEKQINRFDLLEGITPIHEGNLVEAFISYVSENKIESFSIPELLEKMSKDKVFEHLNFNQEDFQDKKYLPYKLDLNGVRRHLLTKNYVDDINIGGMHLKKENE